MKYRLAKNDFRRPPLREVRKQIRMSIDCLAISYAEYTKNRRMKVIRDKGAIYEILCLERALEILPKRERSR